MSDKVYNVPPEWASRAYVNADKYQQMYKASIDDPAQFCAQSTINVSQFIDG